MKMRKRRIKRGLILGPWKGQPNARPLLLLWWPHHHRKA
ncbi:hypothetical protein ACUXSM_007269 [Burkholderia sp. 132550021-2]|jgi:hypothetical protein|nr:hypothetical protein BCO23253_07836 [Burkholderia contaminans]